MGTLIMGAIFVLESRYAETRPRIADTDGGRIYPLNVHGIVYVTSGEQFRIHILETAAVTCVFGFAFMFYLELRRRKRECVGWIIISVDVASVEATFFRLGIEERQSAVWWGRPSRRPRWPNSESRVDNLLALQSAEKMDCAFRASSVIQQSV